MIPETRATGSGPSTAGIGHVTYASTGIRPAVSASEEPATPPPHPPELQRPTLFRSGDRAVPVGEPIIIMPPLPDAVVEAPFAPMERPPTRKMTVRRRRSAVVAFVVIAAAVLTAAQVIRKDDTGRVITIAPAASALPPEHTRGMVVPRPTAAAAGKAPTGASAATEPAERDTIGAGRPPTDTTDSRPTRKYGTSDVFRFADGYGPVLGTEGKLRHFKVAVDRTVEQGSGGDFADEVDDTLGDPRSWVGGHKLRLQRVPADAYAEFTIYLASARMSTRICASGGLTTGGYTSCRLSGQVVINDDRWQDAVPDYDASLTTYRAYAINHEVGHQLGHEHETCPGKGKPAPVMQQQTYGLMGCTANGWPYLDGKRYTGPRVK